MDKVHMTILGNLKIIGWFEGFNLVKVTTLDGTELKLKSAGDLVGRYEDQLIREFYAQTRSK
jgi:hypothetical protein